MARGTSVIHSVTSRLCMCGGGGPRGRLVSVFADSTLRHIWHTFDECACVHIFHPPLLMDLFLRSVLTAIMSSGSDDEQGYVRVSIWTSSTSAFNFLFWRQDAPREDCQCERRRKRRQRACDHTAVESREAGQLQHGAACRHPAQNPLIHPQARCELP